MSIIDPGIIARLIILVLIAFIICIIITIILKKKKGGKKILNMTSYIQYLGFRKKTLKTIITIIIMICLLSQKVTIIKASQNREYLNITLADIIITWYNASGVAIGNTQLYNAIQSAYGNITINDLVDNNVIVAEDPSATKEDIKQAIGYGSASVPYLKVNSSNLQSYAGGLPTDEVAKTALTAMFSWENTPITESIFSALGTVVSMVANTGKIGYYLIQDGLTQAKEWPLIKTLRDVYHNFTDSTYFQDLVNEKNDLDYLSPYSLLNPIEYADYRFASFTNSTHTKALPSVYLPKDCILIRYYSGGWKYGIVNITQETKKIYHNGTNSLTINNYVIENYGMSGYNTNVSANTMIQHTSYIANNYTTPIGMAINIPMEAVGATKIIEYCAENNPWGATGTPGTGTGNGVTDYINNQVGNITKNNYQNLTSNIDNGSYMYIINRNQYYNVIEQITQNTNNGNYIENGTIINNYNITIYQPPTSVDIRPTMIPAPSGQPAQPFISPRPSPLPDETENAIYQGGISESIKDKFPFCIPWDIQALVNNMWSSDRRAPYIHWDATFGSWGKLGEVDIDLSDYDTVASIFRSTTLILWIVGLIMITRNIIGS